MLFVTATQPGVGAVWPAALSRHSRVNPVRLVAFDRMVLDEVTIGPVGSHDGQAQNAGVLLKAKALKKEDFPPIWRPDWVG